jgi:hypothetical protein
MRQAARFPKRYIHSRAILAAVGFSVICWACPSRWKLLKIRLRRRFVQQALSHPKGKTDILPPFRFLRAQLVDEVQDAVHKSKVCEADRKKHDAGKPLRWPRDKEHHTSLEPFRSLFGDEPFRGAFGLDPKFETLRNRDNCSERRFGWQQPVFSK